MIKRFIKLSSLLLFLNCNSYNIKNYSEQYVTVWGRLAAPPKITENRLFIYLKKDAEENQDSGVILVCVTENSQKNEILKNLAISIVESNKPVYLLGSPIHAGWHEYIEGIDFEITAIGYYNPSAQKYQTIITTYGTELSDLIRNVSWKDFISTLGKKAVDTAM